MNKIKLVSVFTSLLALLLLGCGPVLKTKAIAEQGVEIFHEKLSDRNLDEIWDQADPRFRQTFKEEKYTVLMNAVVRDLGKVKSTSTTNWKVKYNLETTVRLEKKTVFDKGEGKETFTFLINGTNATLLEYHIQSTSLVSK